MASLAKDTVSMFYPDVVDVRVNGVPIGVATNVDLPAGAREASVSAVVVSKGSVHGVPGDSLPHAFQWKLFAEAGGRDAELLSPTQPSSLIRVLNPADVVRITLTTTSRFETIETIFTLTVP